MKKLLSLMIVLSLAPMAFAKPEIKNLPQGLKSSAAALEATHQAGVEIFFRSLEEDCDVPQILDNKFFKSGNRNGIPAMFRIESRVEGSCLRRQIWECRSVFEGNAQDGKYTYKYTDCEDDSPLVED